MVHTNIENKYIGLINKIKHGESKFQILFSPIFHSFYILLYLKQQEVALNKPNEEIGP